MIGRTLGGYRIVEQVGMGGMATVFKAYDASTDRYVALKTLPEQYSKDPQFVERFRREAKAIAKLEHLHILPLFAYGEDDGVAYLAMRYLPAGTLSNHIKQKGQMPLDEAARLLSQIASALDHAHANGVLHRDIKPSNVLIDKDANAYLTDFGIARMVEGTLDLTGDAILGTPQYMSPEQCQGRKDLTPASDQYSLGVMLYEMVTGRVPFQAETPLAVIIMQINGSELPPPSTLRPNLPEAAEAVILKSLARNPDDRYPSCDAMAKAFAQAVNQQQTTAATRPAQAAALPTSFTISPATVRPTTQSDPEPTMVQTSTLQKAARSGGVSPLVVGGAIAVGVVVIGGIALLSNRPTDTAITPFPPEQTAVAAAASETVAAVLSPSETPIPPTPSPEATQTTAIIPTQTGVVIPTETPAIIPTQTQVVIPTQTEAIVPTQTEAIIPTQTEAIIPTQTVAVIPTQTEAVIPTQTRTAPSATPTNVASAQNVAAAPDNALPTQVAMLLDAGDAGGAIEQITAAINKAPEDGRLYLLRGQAQMVAGNIDDALTDYAYAVTFAPDEPETFIQRSAAYRVQGNYIASTDDLTQAIQLQPDRAELYILRGDNYRNMGEAENALADNNKAIELEPENARFYVERATTYSWFGNLQGATDDYNKALELEPDNADVYILRGANYRWQYAYDLALADFMKARALTPDNSRAYLGSVQVLIAALDAGESLNEYDLDDALEDANRAIELSPDDSETWLQRGKVERYLGDTSAAINDFTRSIQIYDASGEAYLNRGYAYTDTGEYDEAREDFERILDVDPNNVDALQGRIEAYLEAIDNDKPWNDYDLDAALVDANTALMQDDSNPISYLLRGKVLNRLGQPEAALEDLNRTVSSAPTMAWGYLERGYIHGTLGETDDAVVDFQRAIELDPEDSWLYAALGDVLYDADRDSEALEAYRLHVEKAGDEAEDYILERIAELEKQTA